MASFLGHVRQWELFDRKLKALQRRDGFSIFHATEFTHKTGEFAGWSDEKCKTLIYDLTILVRDNLTEGITVHLERDRYLNEYRTRPIPKKMNLDSQYGVCFRACIRHVLDLVLRDGKRHRLNVVIEDGHVNIGDTFRIYNDLKSQLKRRHSIDLLGTIKKTNKIQSSPLMISDFLAYSYSRMRSSKMEGGMDYAAATPEPRKNEAGLTFLELRTDSLRQLKEEFQKDREDAAFLWRSRRDSR